jgi:hypothetical protein
MLGGAYRPDHYCHGCVLIRFRLANSVASQIRVDTRRQGQTIHQHIEGNQALEGG